MSKERTILADVAPGDLTGLYYITICNLPFGTTWQNLKDWIKPVCKVDHVEVFPTSTSGWVRLKGKSDFESAWRILNGGVFNGRSIIASDKNKTESIKIKELVDGSSHITHSQIPRCHPETSTQYGSLTSPAMPHPYVAASYGQFYAGNFSSSSGAGYPSIAGPSYSSQPIFSSAMNIPSSYATAESMDYYNNLNPAAATYYGNEFSLPFRGQADAYGSSALQTIPPTDYSTEPHADYHTYIPTEPRKVYISPFPPRAQAEDVESWIYQNSGLSVDQIICVEIPRSTNGNLRGYVLAIFETIESANHAIQFLKRQRFQDNKIAARLAVEGVTPSDVSVPTGPRALESNHRGKSHHSRHKESRGSSSKHSSSDKKYISDKKASSSSKKDSSSSSEKKKSSDKKNSSSSSDRRVTRDAGPVIADGTSRKHDRYHSHGSSRST